MQSRAGTILQRIREDGKAASFILFLFVGGNAALLSTICWRCNGIRAAIGKGYEAACDGRAAFFKGITLMGYVYLIL